MAKVLSEEKLPKKIDDYIIYSLNGESIMRKKSGFTSEKMTKDPKYAVSRQNAGEFGSVSSLCKKMRMGLNGVLPKKNNLAICNSLVRQMKGLVYLDDESVRGERQLWKAFLNEKAREMMTGYDFNPNGILPKALGDGFVLDSSGNLLLSGLSMKNGISFPNGSNSFGIRLHHFDFDFIKGMSTLYSSEWLFLKNDSVVDDVLLRCSIPENPIGSLFSICEIQFFVSDRDGFVPLPDDGGKVVHVLRVI